MERELIFYNLYMAQGVLADFFVNDLPLFEELMRGQATVNGPINELLVPGENEVSIRLMSHTDQWRGHYLKFFIFRIVGGDPERPDIEVLHECQFPQQLDELPEDRRKLPYHHRATFEHGVALHEPPHLKADAEPIPEEGTPELRDAVTALHQALSAGDAQRYLDLVSFHMQSRALAYEGHAEHSVGAQRKIFEEFFAQQLQVKPLDLADLHFEPRAGGRVAYVRRIDGTCPLYAQQKDDPTEQLRAPLAFTKDNGRWQLY